MPEKKMNKHSGRCICGRVKFTVDIDEIPRVYNCHCIDCRKSIGGMITIIDLREGALSLDESKLGTFEHSGGSGNKIKTHYCIKCTAPIFRYVHKWKRNYLFAGLLDDISVLKKAKNIWYTDSHFPFMEITDDNIKF